MSSSVLDVTTLAPNTAVAADPLCFAALPLSRKPLGQRHHAILIAVMRPTPARILLSALVIGALTAGVLTSQLIFYLVALLAGFLLATSLSTTRNPLTQALHRFRGFTVEVRAWGALPPLPPGATLVLTSVNVLGAGVHVFFQAERRRFHPSQSGSTQERPARIQHRRDRFRQVCPVERQEAAGFRRRTGLVHSTQ